MGPRQDSRRQVGADCGDFAVVAAPIPDNLSPTSTAEEDRHTAGQRSINRVWELTQALIAGVVVIASVYASLRGIDAPGLQNTSFLVVGFYFGRTNHQRVGGITLGR